jgi:hypothetical protein
LWARMEMSRAKSQRRAPTLVAAGASSFPGLLYREPLAGPALLALSFEQGSEL